MRRQTDRQTSRQKQEQAGIYGEAAVRQAGKRKRRQAYIYGKAAVLPLLACSCAIYINGLIDG